MARKVTLLAVLVMVGAVFGVEQEGGETTRREYSFPEIHSVMEREKEIFGGIDAVGADGYAARNLRVVGAHGRSFTMHYKSKRKQDNLAYNLDADSSLKSVACDSHSLVLRFGTAADAQRALTKLNRAHESASFSKVLVTGKKLWSCPQSVHDPSRTEMKDAPKNGNTPRGKVRMMESVRRVKDAVIDPDEPLEIEVETSKGFLSDLFEELSLWGETDLLPMNGGGAETKEKRMGGVRGSWKARKTSRRLLGGPKARANGLKKKLKKLRKKAKNVVTNPTKVIKGAKKLTKSTLKSTKKGFKKFGDMVSNPSKLAAFVQKVALKMQQAYNFLNVKLLDKRGSFAFPSWFKFGLNYPATQVWIFNTDGEIEIFGGTASELEKEVKDNPPDGEKKETESGGEASTSASMQLYCLKCFVGLKDHSVGYHLKIATLESSIELWYKTSFVATFEMLTSVTLAAEYELESPRVPIPVVSIPLGVTNIGMAVGMAVTVGVEFTSAYVYYKYEHESWIKAGAKYKYYTGVGGSLSPVISGGNSISKSTGPIVYAKAELSFYVRPVVQLVFTDVATVYAGPQPTFVFNMAASQSSSCALKLKMSFQCPIILGFLIGINTPTLEVSPQYGKEWAFNVFGNQKLGDVCLARSLYTANSNKFGAPGNPPGFLSEFGEEEKEGEERDVVEADEDGVFENRRYEMFSVTGDREDGRWKEAQRVGVVFLGISLAAVCGGAWWWSRKKTKDAGQHHTQDYGSTREIA